MYSNRKIRDLAADGTWYLLQRWGTPNYMEEVYRGNLPVAIASMISTSVRADRIQAEQDRRVDYLTKLGNKRAFDKALARELRAVNRSGSPLTLHYLDIDGFKEHNDTNGHSSGNRVLQELAAGLVSHVRPHDHVVRIGGDEMAVLLPDTDFYSSLHLAVGYIDRLNSLFDRSKVSLSVGVTTYEPSEYDVLALQANKKGKETLVTAYDRIAEDLMTKADFALYRAKALKDNGRSNVRGYRHGVLTDEHGQPIEFTPPVLQDQTEPEDADPIIK